MSADNPRTVLCLASYEKGAEFLTEAHELGVHTVLLTLVSLEGSEYWPRGVIDELYAMPDLGQERDVIHGVSYLARFRSLDRIVALDDYDVEMAATLREHLQVPGMEQSEARHFRDKLAMRVRAREAGVPVPEFVPTFNDDVVNAYLGSVPGPWVLKPRSEVSTIGIRRIETSDEMWRQLDQLGDRRSYFLIERFMPGNVYHVDSIVVDGEPVFAEAHRYGRPPLSVFHGGGVAMSRTLPRGSAGHTELLALNRDVLQALGLHRGVSHAEFIEGPDGEMRFLEAGARVGGANTADMVEAATGINLWKQWARLELLPAGSFQLSEPRGDYAGVLVSLARQEWPDTGEYADEEIVSRLHKRHHVGFVLASPRQERIEELLAEYDRRFAEDFLASMPPYMQRPTTA